MASYYKNTMIVNRHIDNLIKKLKGQTINLNLMIYDLTLNFEVSALYVKKRLKILEEMNVLTLTDKEVIIK